MTRPTAEKIAQKAGVSPAPVSWMIHQPEKVALGTLDRVLRAVRERGLSTPRDIFLVHFDAAESSRYCNPPLVTLRVPAARIGRQAI
jgi:DNA-binding LacI/PurR family transcriptional regulator